MSRRQKAILTSISILLVLVVSAALLLLRTYYMPASSMAPTLVPGDRIVATRLPRRLGALRRGDIVVFQLPKKAFREESLPVAGGLYGVGLIGLKRLIGLPGDRIRIKAGDGVYVNGRRLREPYIKGDSQIVKYQFPGGGGELRVPPGEVFVLGDDRNNSSDSHIWGPLPARNIIGKGVAIYYPFNRMRILR